MKIIPNDILKFGGLVIGSAASGLVVGVGVGYVVGRIMWSRMDFGGLVGLVVGIVLAYPLGVFLGLVIVKGFWRMRGSLLLGLCGILLAEFVTLGVYHFFHVDAISSFVIPAFAVLTPVLGASGYYLGRVIGKLERSV